jgi:hypothetical protein
MSPPASPAAARSAQPPSWGPSLSAWTRQVAAAASSWACMFLGELRVCEAWLFITAYLYSSSAVALAVGIAMHLVLTYPLLCYEYRHRSALQSRASSLALRCDPQLVVLLAYYGLLIPRPCNRCLLPLLYPLPSAIPPGWSTPARAPAQCRTHDRWLLSY